MAKADLFRQYAEKAMRQAVLRNASILETLTRRAGINEEECACATNSS